MSLLTPFILLYALFGIIAIGIWLLIRMWLIDYANKKLDKTLSKYFKEIKKQE